MILKKYKIWILLGVTLILAYFAPPKDNTLITTGNKGLSSDMRASLFPQGGDQINQSIKPVEVIDVVTRTIEPENSKTLDVFSIAYQAPVLKSKSKKSGAFSKKLNLTKSNSPDVKPIEILPPQAPPLPFKALGNYTEDGNQVIFVQHNSQNLVLRVGDTILDKYKLEAVDANSLTFIYLPMDVRQTLSLAH